MKICDSIHTFSTALCGASTNVSFDLRECLVHKWCFKKCNMLSKKRKIDSECREYNETWLCNYFVKQHGNKVLWMICNDVIAVMKE